MTVENKKHFQDQQPIDKILRPFHEFVNAEVSGGIVLILAVVLAMIIANSPFKESYFEFWLTPLSFSIGTVFELTKPVILWINDGLMALFFLMVGLEIKREILVGELASVNKALLPAVAALGGMTLPALIYIFFNLNSPWLNAWAVPVATDIAFTLGILALLGKRVPPTLKLFLASFAIVDDIGAVLIIAFFYTENLAFVYIGLTGILLLGLFAYNYLGGKNLLVYLLVGTLIWFLILKSGVHATIAGILIAATIPATKNIDLPIFADQAKEYLETLSYTDKDHHLETELHHSAIKQLESLCAKTETPLQKLEHSLAPWVFFLIVPIFAFSNAGVDIGLIFESVPIIEIVSHPVVLGILFGLLVGNPVGINTFIYLANRINLIKLPTSVTWIHVFGVSWLAGVGFTMSHFIASLAFAGPEDVLVLNISRFVILIGSTLAGLTGFIILFFSERLSKKLA